MLINSLPTKATSSFKVSPSRPPETLVLVEPNRPARSEYDEQALTGIGTPRDERRRVPDKARGSPMTVNRLPTLTPRIASVENVTQVAPSVLTPRLRPTD